MVQLFSHWIKYLALLFSLIFCVSCSFEAKSETLNPFENSESIQRIVKLEYFTDTTASLSVEEVLELSGDFKLSEKEIPNMDVTMHNHWFRFQVQNVSSEPNFLLEIDNALLYESKLFRIENGEVISAAHINSLDPISSREFNHQNHIYELDVKKSETADYLVMVNSGELLLVPFVLGTQQTLFEEHKTKGIAFGIFFGIILVMFLYNLVIYFMTRDLNYLLYVGYILTVGMTQLILQGYTFQYLWPNSPEFARQSIILVGAFSGITTILFCKRFLKLDEFMPFSIKVLNVLLVSYTAAIFLRAFDQYNASYRVIDLNAAILSFYVLYIAIKISLKGYRPAKFFLLAWSVLLVGIFLFVMRTFGIVPHNDFTSYTMPLGNAIEVVLLSFALADKINIYRREKEEAQKNELKLAQENEQIVKDQNIVLEQKVKERTLALEQAQSQLVQNEKMASVGQLAAGVAHEINNPVNFVTNSITPLKRDIEDILELLDKYKELAAASDQQEMLKNLKQFEEKIELDYLLGEVKQLLNGIDHGATRTAEIVKGLKVFSRVDESDFKRGSITEGIDSTLTLLQSKLGKIQIAKENYSIPEVEAHHGKLNQVFMNLLNNAVDAIRSKEGLSESDGVITISTEIIDSEVRISFKDNGVGIPEETLSKIFDPFFTTKDVGEGTGLGLAISVGIMEDHKGGIRVNSTQGEGTEFIVHFPILEEKAEAPKEKVLAS